MIPRQTCKTRLKQLWSFVKRGFRDGEDQGSGNRQLTPENQLATSSDNEPPKPPSQSSQTAGARAAPQRGRSNENLNTGSEQSINASTGRGRERGATATDEDGEDIPLAKLLSHRSNLARERSNQSSPGPSFASPKREGSTSSLPTRYRRNSTVKARQGLGQGSLSLRQFPANGNEGRAPGGFDRLAYMPPPQPQGIPKFCRLPPGSSSAARRARARTTDLGSWGFPMIVEESVEGGNQTTSGESPTARRRRPVVPSSQSTRSQRSWARKKSNPPQGAWLCGRCEWEYQNNHGDQARAVWLHLGIWPPFVRNGRQKIRPQQCGGCSRALYCTLFDYNDPRNWP